MTNIETHLRNELGLSELTILETNDSELHKFKPGEIFDVTKVNNNFVKIYKKFYDEDLVLKEKYEQVVDNMISFCNHLSTCSDRYTFIRRIKESLDLLREADPVLNYSAVKVANMETPIDIQYQPILRTSIDNYNSVVKKHYDVSTYFGNESILQDIYEIIPTSIDEYGNVTLKIRLTLHRNSKFNIIRSQIYCNKYSITDVEVYDNYKLIKSMSDCSIEKYKDYINIAYDDIVTADEVVLTVSIEASVYNDNKTYILGIGVSRVGEISDWIYSNVNSISVPYNKGVILSNYLYENYNSSSIDGVDIFLPNISTDGVVRIQSKITIYSYNVNVFTIHPIPTQVTDGEYKFLLYIDEHVIDANSSDYPDFFLLGDMLYISKEAITTYGLTISQDITVEYIPEDKDISRWYPKDYVMDVQLFQYKNNHVTCISTNGDYWAGTMTEYSNFRYLDANESGDLVEHIAVSDGEKFEISRTEYSVPGLCYKQHILYNFGVATDVTLEHFYSNEFTYLYRNWAIHGTVNAFITIDDKRFKVPIQEYYNPDTGKDYGFFDGVQLEGTPVRLDFNSKADAFFRQYPETVLDIYFQPFGTDEVLSNISLTKSSNTSVNVDGGKLTLENNNLILDPQVRNWEIIGNSYVHPKHSNVRYSPVEVSNNIVTDFTYIDGVLTANVENTSLSEKTNVSIYSTEVMITSTILFNKITYVNTPLIYLEVPTSE